MKIDRLIGILSVLLQKEKTTAPELIFLLILLFRMDCYGMSIMNAMTTWQKETLITEESGTGQEHRNLRSILSLGRHKQVQNVIRRIS